MTTRACVHKVTCNMGCVGSRFRGEVERVLTATGVQGCYMLVVCLPAANTDFPCNGVILEASNERLGTALGKRKYARTVTCMIMHFSLG